MIRRQPFRAPPRQQRGIAVILLVILVGLALIVTATGVFRTVRAAQESTLAAHAKTPAEATAWNGVELIRSYLEIVDPDTVDAWVASPPSASAPITLAMTGAPGVTAEVTQIEAVPLATREFRVTALVTGNAGAGVAKANVPVEVVYNVKLREDTTSATNNVPQLNFYKSVVITGDMDLGGAAHAQLNVLGDVTVGNVKITGLEDVNSTGNVKIGSADVSVKHIHANGDIELTNKARADTVFGRKSVLISGDGAQGHVRANGPVTFLWARATLVETRDSLTTGIAPGACSGVGDNVYIQTARVNKEVFWYSCSGGVEDLVGNKTLRYHGAGRLADGYTDIRATQHLQTRESMDIRTPLHVGRFTSLKDITHTTTGNPDVVRYCAKLRLHIPNYDNAWGTRKVGYGATTDAGDSRNVVNMAPLPNDPAICNFDGMPTATVAEVPEYEITPPLIDANTLKSSANLVFERDANDEIQVTVRAMHGLTAGVYTLGYSVDQYNNVQFADHLCATGDIGPASTRRAASGGQRKCNNPKQRICQNNYGESCFAYNGGSSTWSVGADNSKTSARGVYWFKGNLKLGLLSYVATWIATGNIEAKHNHRTYAPNFAGVDKLCRNATLVGAEAYEPTIDSPDLAGIFPTNFCNVDANDNVTGATNLPLGNVAMVAGSYDANNVFSGGTITTSGLARFDGTVVAGDRVVVGQSTTISGNVIGAGQGGSTRSNGTPLESGDLSGKLILTTPPIAGLNPGNIGCMHASCLSNEARVQWARYR